MTESELGITRKGRPADIMRARAYLMETGYAHCRKRQMTFKQLVKLLEEFERYIKHKNGISIANKEPRKAKLFVDDPANHLRKHG